jgi:uncharacterized RDD family membrane protein YckC
MQCPSCRAVYSNGLEICPRCKTPASTSSTAPEAGEAITAGHDQEEKMGPSASVAEDSYSDDSMVAAAAPTGSTLIEFPGSGKLPQWRKQLSERVREIQERRAREAEEAARHPPQPTVEPPATQLGLVPSPDVPQINPLVAAALRRIERAHQPPSSSTRARGGGGAATAVARFVEDEYQIASNPAALEAQASVPLPKPEKPSTEVARERGLVVVSAPQTTNRTETVNKETPTRRVSAKVIDDTVLESLDAEASVLPDVEPYDDRAALHRRIVASIIDLFVIAFASSPFAAIIELTNGNWSDARVAASMGGIILVIMFLYLTASTALSGRTWGMSLLSLRPVDADTGLPPTTKQSVSRAILYMVSLALLGLGILYAFFDADGRTAHDHFSGTVVVHE